MIRLLRRLLCRHSFVERGTFKRDGYWWATEACACGFARRARLIRDDGTGHRRIKYPCRLVCLEPVDADADIGSMFRRVHETPGES